MDGKTYKLNTMRDLMSIPVDRLDAFIRDLQYAIEFAHFSAGESLDPADLMEEMIWTDDDDHMVSMFSADGGMHIASLVVEDEPTNGSQT